MKTRTLSRELTPQLTTRNLIILSALMVVLVYLLQGDVGFNLADEGFLWYGTIQSAMGQVPVRDFQAYDPGRYYWGAIWFNLLRSDGMIALRISQAAFQFVGLSLAFLLLRRVLNSWAAVIGAGTLLLIWMFPPWKVYEPVIMIAAIYFAVLLIENPSIRRHLYAGIFIGVAAFLGRNHGLYCGVGFLLVTIFGWWKIERGSLLRRLSALSLGTIIGYLPMLFMLAFIPGLFGSFIDGLVFNLQHATNLPLAVPWPWRQGYRHRVLKDAINTLAVGTLFLVIPAFYLLALTRLFVKSKIPPHPLLIASAFVGVIYLHYTFERPHIYYLAWTIPPFIIGLLAIPPSFPNVYRKKLSYLIWPGLILLSLTAAGMAGENYFLIKAKAFAESKLERRYQGDFALAMNDYGLVKTDIRGNNLWITTNIADIINAAKAIDKELIPPSDGVLIVPYWTALYPILRKQSPVWDIYPLFPRSLASQKTMIQDLERKHINWAMVCHSQVDTNPKLGFRNTHSYVWQYLTTNFQAVDIEYAKRLGGRQDCEVLHRADRTAAQY